MKFTGSNIAKAFQQKGFPLVKQVKVGRDWKTSEGVYVKTIMGALMIMYEIPQWVTDKEGRETTLARRKSMVSKMYDTALELGIQPSNAQRKQLSKEEAIRMSGFIALPLKTESFIKKIAKLDKSLASKVKEVMSKNATKSEIMKLIELYAVKIYSSDMTGVRRAQQLNDKFYKYYDKLADKYPEYDFESNRFWSGLESQARKWWDKQLVKGPGRHW